jgi:hypothetical protein
LHQEWKNELDKMEQSDITRNVTIQRCAEKFADSIQKEYHNLKCIRLHALQYCTSQDQVRSVTASARPVATPLPSGDQILQIHLCCYSTLKYLLSATSYKSYL